MKRVDLKKALRELLNVYREADLDPPLKFDAKLIKRIRDAKAAQAARDSQGFFQRLRLTLPWGLHWAGLALAAGVAGYYAIEAAHHGLEKEPSQEHQPESAPPTAGSSSAAPKSPDSNHIPNPLKFLMDPATTAHGPCTEDQPKLKIQRVSNLPNGGQLLGASSAPDITPDGRYLVFAAQSTRLISGDPTNTNSGYFIFRKDLTTGNAVLVSAIHGSDDPMPGSHSDPLAGMGHSISTDGNRIAFYGMDTKNRTQIFVREVSTRTTFLVSSKSNEPGNNHSVSPQISYDGRFVVFSSLATNLTSDEVSGTKNQVYLHDLDTKSTTLISKTTSGSAAGDDAVFPSLSGDGKRVLFESKASGLTPGIHNGYAQVYLWDRDSEQPNRIIRLSVSPSGSEGNHDSGSCRSRCLSSNGRYVVFSSHATNLQDEGAHSPIDYFVRETTGQNPILHRTIKITIKNTGEQDFYGAPITQPVAYYSYNGRFVTYNSTLKVPGKCGDRGSHQHIFLFDGLISSSVAHRVIRVSRTEGSKSGNGNSFYSAVTNDGKTVAFDSQADNLVSSDSNGTSDVFLVNLLEMK